MQKNILVRSIAALSGIVMLASVAACGDNTATTTDNSSPDLRQLLGRRRLLSAGRC